MLQLPVDLRFLDETLDDIRLVFVLIQQHLDRQVASQIGVAPSEDGAHSASRDLALELVAAVGPAVQEVRRFWPHDGLAVFLELSIGLAIGGEFLQHAINFVIAIRKAGPVSGHILAPVARRLPLEKMVKAQCRDTAETVGLFDRGLLAAGYRADLNLIDYDRLKLHAPEVAHDLPSGGRRLIQRADGYVATIVAGQVTYRDGEPTGALPGRLLRGAQAAPEALAAE